MAEVRIIPRTISAEPRKLRVAAYCRVSTQQEEQECSLKAQVAHFTKRICDNPEWEFAGIYAEQGSGTRIKEWREMERLLADCEADRIDIVLTKSISRLSRNTVDALAIYNQVVRKGIELQFELERLSTNDKRVRKLFATLAAIAQNES